MMKHIFLVLLSFCFFVPFPPLAHSELISIYWTGTVSSLISFGADSVPDGVSEGSVISGSLLYESTQCIGHYDIMGDLFGDKYRFSDALVHTVRIGAHEWRLIGGDISLVFNRGVNWKAFDLYSTSENSVYEVFPKYAGSFEVGFALFDDTDPYELYETQDIERALIDFDHISFANGSLTTQSFDENNDIIDGYYFEFDIFTASPSPIPEPSTSSLLLLALIASFLLRKETRFGAQLK